jgi:predicted cytidylate kinase
LSERLQRRAPVALNVMRIQSRGHQTVDSDASFADIIGGDELVFLTVSGHPGSGTTTLVGNICQRRGWSSLNGGQVFREAASERGVSVEEFSTICESEPEVDKILDAKLLDAMQASDGPDVVESRLCGWWAHNHGLGCIRLWLAVSESERAQRVTNREGGSVEDALERVRQRMADDQARYETLYDITLDDMTPYNLIVDGDDLSPDEVVDTVEAMLDAKGVE